MYNLALHIEYLLLRHDCVTVPGFGAFINVRSSAELDEDNLVLSPMRNEVRFNPSVSFDDGLLASSFARKHGVSFEQGREILQKETALLKSALSTDREITLGRLGIISIDDENRISFKPLSSPASLMEQMGFISVPIRKKVQEKENLISEEEENCKSEIADEKESGEMESVAKGPERKFSDNCYYIAINKTFAKVAASLVVLVAVALSILLPTSGNYQNIDRASVVPLIDSTPVVEKNKRIENTEEKLIPAETDEIAVNTVEKAQEQPEDMYYLIIATFRTVSEAENFISMQKNDNYDYEAVESRKVCRVSAASSESKEDLLSILRNEKFRSRFPEAWIWHE